MEFIVVNLELFIIVNLELLCQDAAASGAVVGDN